MADIMYTIEYSESGGLETKQEIVAIGGEVDRIAFVTTEDTIKTLQKEKKKAGLQRNPKKKVPFDDSFPDLYDLPLKPKWFTVLKKGKQQAFLLDCVEIDENRKTKLIKDGPAHSLPFPV